MKYSALFIALLMPTYLFSQINYFDDVRLAIYNSQGEERINNLKTFCKNGRNTNFDTFYKMIHLFENEIKLHPSIQNTTLKYVYFANYLLLQSNYERSIKYVDSVLKFLPSTNANQSELGYLKNIQATAFIRSSKIKEGIAIALQIMHEALSKNDMDLYLRSKLTVGWGNMEIGNTSEAIRYFHEIIIEANTPELENCQVGAYSNLTSCYGQLGIFDSARYCLNKGKALAIKHHNSLSYSAFLNFEVSFLMVAKKYDSINSYHEEIIKVRKQINDPYFLVSDMCEFAMFYCSIKNFEKAFNYINQANEIIETKHLRQKKPMVYHAYAIYYRDIKDFEKANVYLEKNLGISDSLYKETSSSELAFMQAKYEKSEQERIIVRQQLSLKNKNFLIIGSLLLLALSSLIGRFAYKNIRRRKENELQRKLWDEQLKSAQAVIDAEEKERTRIAADLHDGIGQLLSAAKMNLHVFEDKIGKTDSILTKAIDLVNESAKEIRSISHNIMPNALLKAGLATAIKDFIEKLDQCKLQIHLNAIGLNEKLNSNIEIMVYRIVQESVHNVIKHADANRLDISLVNENNTFEIMIEDNGKGFESNKIAKLDGIGLKNIKARVEFLKGKLEIDSKVNNGTVISISIPTT
jgi:two-component system, NarL family, sensor kinase